MIADFHGATGVYECLPEAEAKCCADLVILAGDLLIGCWEDEQSVQAREVVIPLGSGHPASLITALFERPYTSNWLDKRAIFNYRPRFGLKRDRKRQAKRLLEKGMALLCTGSIDEADVHFGAALKVNPHLVDSLSRGKRQSLALELERCRKGGLNAANLLLQLWAARKQSAART